MSARFPEPLQPHEQILVDLKEYKELVEQARKKTHDLQYPPIEDKVEAGFKAAVTQVDTVLGGVGHLAQGGVQYAKGMGDAGLSSAAAGSKAALATALNAVSGYLPRGWEVSARKKASELKTDALFDQNDALVAELNAEVAFDAADKKAQVEFNAANEITSKDFLDFTADLSFEAAERFFKNIEKNIGKIEELLNRTDPAFCAKDPDKDLSKLNLLIKHAKEDVTHDSKQLLKSLAKDGRRVAWDNLCTSVSQAFESMRNAIKNSVKSKLTSTLAKAARVEDLKKKGFPTTALGATLTKAKNDAKSLETKLKEDINLDFPRPKKRKEF